MEDISTDNSVLRLKGEFEAFTARELFDHFVVPELLVKWWPQEATVDPRQGGRYEYRWPSREWVLTGEFTTFDPGMRLGFTWSWSHEPSIAPRKVDIEFKNGDPCARVIITHGPFGDSQAEQVDRSAIREGWIHFAMRLAGLRKGEAS